MYGLYLHQATRPVATGSWGECKKAIGTLSQADRKHGWTIKPYHPNPHPVTVSQSLWAIVGTGILLFVAVTSLLALRGHLR